MEMCPKETVKNEPRKTRGCKQKSLSRETSRSRPTSTPISFDKLLKRVNKRIKIEYETEEDSKTRTQKLKEIQQKQKEADERRNKKYSEYSEKWENFSAKLSRMRREQKKKLDDKKRKQMGKERAVLASKKSRLRKKMKVARLHKMKANEISFLMMLEKEAKKRELDEKLEETRKRKEKILESIQEEKKEQMRQKMKRVEESKKTWQISKIEKKKKYEGKMGRAERLRTEKLKEKVKTRGSEKKVRTGREKRILFKFDDKVEAVKLEMMLAKRKLDARMKKKTNFIKSKARGSSFDFADLSERETFIKRKGSKIYRTSHKKKNTRKKWKKRKNSKIRDKGLMTENKEPTGGKLLQNYYKFLIKESDHGMVQKRKLSYEQTLSNSEVDTHSKRLSIGNSEGNESALPLTLKTENASKKNLLEKKDLPALENSFTQISEMPELICKTIRKGKKADTQKPETRLCILCDVVLQESDKKHLESKTHKKNKSQYIYTSLEESNCIVLCTDMQLVKERYLNLRKKCRKIRHQISIRCLKLESKSGSKESYNSENKKKLKTLALDLEKQLGLTKRDLPQIRFILEQFKKTLDKNVENDLHICRQIKVPVLLIDFFKSVVSCPKFELSTYIELIDKFFGLLLQICLLRENRVSIFYNNRVTSLADLLLWGWNNMQKHVLILNFLPDVFQTLNLLLKQRLFKYSEVLKPLVIEYIFYSGFIQKLSKQFTNYANNNTLVLNPRVAVLTLKALTLLDTLTSLLKNRINVHIAELTPSLEKTTSKEESALIEKDSIVFDSGPKIPNIESSKESDSIIFILNETECAGCLHLLASILLSKGSSN